jgi:hypothetical protein
MTNPRTQQRCEIETFEDDRAGHFARAPDLDDDIRRLGDSAVEREPPM